MHIAIKGCNFTVNDAIETHLQSKFDRLQRHLGQPAAEAVVELFQNQSKAAGQKVGVQVTVAVSGALLRAEEHAADFFLAIDTVTDALDRQIERYKGKMLDRHKAGSAAIRSEAVTESLIARTKRFTAASMEREDAIEQMELLGHNFFLFVNNGTGEIEVVYRRNQGDYGVLVPERP
ncbi:MAG: ribosome-associated translation inhibitor RaiA [Dehalococcoidia bacterium]|nr:ribosome-associated translation inhibitor RaiA [Dehalococcoidia bacterium]